MFDEYNDVILVLEIMTQQHELVFGWHLKMSSVFLLVSFLLHIVLSPVFHLNINKFCYDIIIREAFPDKSPSNF